MKFFEILVTFATLNVGSGFLVMNNDSSSTDFAKAIVDIIDIYFEIKTARKIHVIEGITADDEHCQYADVFDFQVFYKHLNKREITFKSEIFNGNFHSGSRKRHSVLVFIDSAQFIVDMFRSATLDTFDYRIHFLIISLKTFNANELEELFGVLWHNFILNVSLIISKN